MVGYSRLMGASEAGTLKALKRHRRDLIDGRIADYQGRIVKLTGDGILVEFPSVVNAVACAVEIQRKMAERNADVPPDQRIEFRIGVHLGDIISEDDDIFGDGVNVAARIEGIAKPGGVCVSSAVHDNVGNRLVLDFEDMGEQALKNIDRRVRVYDIVLEPAPSRLGLRCLLRGRGEDTRGRAGNGRWSPVENPRARPRRAQCAGKPLMDRR